MGPLSVRSLTHASLDQSLTLRLPLAADEIFSSSSPSEDAESADDSNSDSNSGDDTSSDSDSGSASDNASGSDNSDLPAPKTPKKKKKTKTQKAGQTKHKKSLPKRKDSEVDTSKENIPIPCDGRRISDYEKEREESMARNQAMWGAILENDVDGLAAVGLGIEGGRLVHVDSLNPAPLTQPKRKRPATDSIGPPRKLARLSTIEDPSQVTPVHNGADAVGDDDITSLQGPVQTSRLSTPSPPLDGTAPPPDKSLPAPSELPLDSVILPAQASTTSHPESTQTIVNSTRFEPPVTIPNWLQKPVAEISKVSLSTEFDTLLCLLIQLKQKYNFVNKTRGYPKKHRRKLLNSWITDGLGRSSTPPPSSLMLLHLQRNGGHGGSRCSRHGEAVRIL